MNKESKVFLFFFCFVLFLVRQPPIGPGLPHSRGIWITHNDAPHSVGLLSTSDRLVAETSTRQHTQHSQQTNVHASGGIRIHNLNRRPTADLRLRPSGHWDRQKYFCRSKILLQSINLKNLMEVIMKYTNNKRLLKCVPWFVQSGMMR